MTPSVTVQPNSAQVFLGGKMHFQASVQNASNSAVTWAVQPSDGAGSIDASGNYLAPPAAPPSPVRVKVTAVLQSDPSVSGAASVSIQSTLAISPARASLTLSQSLQLHVVSAGVSPSDVTWRAINGGTISQAGLYSPPGAAGVYTVTARLNAAVSGQATVYVTDFPGTLTWRNDNQRSGVNSQELALSPATVNSTTFGKLFSCPVDGNIYAQPLYVANLPMAGGTHNVVFVATENDSVYAFDADANPCQQLWTTSLIPKGTQAVLSKDLLVFPYVLLNQNVTPVIDPLIGITGTPIIDASTSTLYVVAETQQGVASILTYSYAIYALDLPSGQLKIPPKAGSFGTPAAYRPAFASAYENQRPALLLDNGTVYVAFGSYNLPDDLPEDPSNNSLGWLFGFDSRSLDQTGYFSAVLNSPGGGIWESGGGPSADANHNVFVVTGDGKFDAYRGGSNYGDSFLRFAPSSGLAVPDYVTPCDQAADESSGNDVGASAPLLLPDSAGSPHLLVGGSKGGFLYIVNRDSNDYFNAGGCPDLSSVVQTIPPPTGANQPILSTPIYWNGAIYVAPGNGNLVSYALNQGIVSLTPAASRSRETFGPQGATPVMSWNAASNDASTAVLWLIDTSGAFSTPNGPAVLRAYDPGDLSNELYDSGMALTMRDTAGSAVKFTVPTVANGKVYVGTQSEMDVYGLLP